MDLHRGKMTCWSQTVLVVGPESAGKTALCRALQGHKCPDREQLTENSTVGIDTVHWQSVLAFEINRDGSSTPNADGNVTNRVPHARIVTESVEFRISNARDKRKNNTSWTKATIQLRGQVMTLSMSP